MDRDAGAVETGERGLSGEWECMECGYIEAGAKNQRPQVCPDCGASSEALEFFPYEDEDEAGLEDATADNGAIFEDEEAETG